MNQEQRRRRIPVLVTLPLLIVVLSSADVCAFRVIDVSSLAGFTDLGISRWNAAPHTVDGVERSLDGGLRYSVEGGSYEVFRDRFEWEEPAPTVAEFQAAVEGAFAAWEAQDPETGLGTDLYFVPDFETRIVIESVPSTLRGFFKLNRGAEIDLASGRLGGTSIGSAIAFGDPNLDSVTLTSGVPDYSAAVFSGADITMGKSFGDAPWDLTIFRLTLAHEIGHVLSLQHPNASTGSGGFVSAYYDDNYDRASQATALETLTNSFADLIDPMDPDNSPALKQFELCNDPNAGENCFSSPGVDSAGVTFLMDAVIQGVGLQNDEYAARQFLYPFVKVPGDINADKQLTVEDIDLMTSEIRTGEPRYWFDVDGSETVDADDRTEWVHVLQNTYFGDSNLDGEFNSGDLVDVFAAGEYEDDVLLNSTWATGDWNGDGEFDTGDLVLAFQDGGFETGPRVAVNTVPEPASIVTLLIGCFAIVTRARSSGWRLA